MMLKLKLRTMKKQFNQILNKNTKRRTKRRQVERCAERGTGDKEIYFFDYIPNTHHLIKVILFLF